MRLKRMNKALLITTMVGFCLSANASQIAEDASVDYVTSVKSYLSNKVELSQELTSLIQDIQAKQSSLTRLQSALRSTESQIATIQRQNDTRPDRIRQLKGDIQATKSSLDRLINRVAPGAFSAQDAIDILSGTPKSFTKTVGRS